MLKVFFLYIGRPIIRIAIRKLTHQRKTLISWNPPSPNCYKLIFDGAVSAKGKSSGGFIIKDYNGIAVIAQAFASILQAEAIGLKISLLWAQRLQLQQLQVELHILLFIKMIKRVHIFKIPRRLSTLVADINHLCSKFTNFSFQHILGKQIWLRTVLLVYIGQRMSQNCIWCNHFAHLCYLC